MSVPIVYNASAIRNVMEMRYMKLIYLRTSPQRCRLKKKIKKNKIETGLIQICFSMKLFCYFLTPTNEHKCKIFATAIINLILNKNIKF